MEGLSGVAEGFTKESVMAYDYILREESDRFHVYFFRVKECHQQNLGCFESEPEARAIWVLAQKEVNGLDKRPENVELWQSRACSGDEPFLLKASE
jgi:hypothetical protein